METKLSENPHSRLDKMWPFATCGVWSIELLHAPVAQLDRALPSEADTKARLQLKKSLLFSTYRWRLCAAAADGTPGPYQSKRRRSIAIRRRAYCQLLRHRLPLRSKILRRRAEYTMVRQRRRNSCKPFSRRWRWRFSVPRA